MEYNTRRKRYIIIAAIALAVISIAIFLAFRPPNREPEPDSLVDNQNTETDITTEPGAVPRTMIANFSHIVHNLPDSERVVIEQNLTLILRSNGVTDDNTIEDVIIRDGSYIQTFDEDVGIHVTFFLIDIPSLRQTYQVWNDWIALSDRPSNFDDGTTRVLCPDPKDLIFGEFPCTNPLRSENE